MIPDEILFRKKSPYPKTYHPQYEQLLKKKIKEILSDSSSPILSFIDPSKVNTFLSSPSDYGKTMVRSAHGWTADAGISHSD